MQTKVVVVVEKSKKKHGRKHRLWILKRTMRWNWNSLRRRTGGSFGIKLISLYLAQHW